MILAVVDTNVLLSSLLATAKEDSPPVNILRRWYQKEFVLIMSSSIVDELEDAFTRPYFADNISHETQERALASFRRQATWANPLELVERVAPDPRDDHVIATSLSGNATYLVTGDRTLRAVDTFRGVQFVTPREFIDILDQARGAQT